MSFDLLVQLFAFIPAVLGFYSHQLSHSHTLKQLSIRPFESRPKVVMTSHSGSFHSYQNAESRKNQVKILLTHQAMKTFMYYSAEFRDEVTVEWLIKFDKEISDREKSNTRVNWEKYLRTLMRTPPEDIRIRKVQQRARGGSGTNPYISSEYVFEFDVRIDPFSICKRLLAIREDLSKDWVSDLNMVGTYNEIMRKNHLLELVKGKEAAKHQQTGFEIDDAFSTATPYRTENHNLLMDLITTVAMQRCEREIRATDNKAAINWFDRMKAETVSFSHEELLKSFFCGQVASRKDDLRYSELGEKMGKFIMATMETVALEYCGYLKETREDHNKLLTDFLNERLNDQMSVTDLLNYQYRLETAEPGSPNE